MIELAKFIWKKEQVPQDLEVKQVYAIAFAEDGNILLRIEDNKYKLTGGKPEKEDTSFEETVKREYFEELNVEIDDIHYLGYLLVKDNNEEYAQVRMIAKVKNIGESRPDTDTGKTYKRFICDIHDVKQYLHYPDEAGNQMLDDAIKLAKEKYNLN